MKRKLLLLGLLSAALLIYFIPFTSETATNEKQVRTLSDMKKEKTSKKTMSEKMEAIEDRIQFEYDMQKNPYTGLIPLDEKESELNLALQLKQELNFQARSFSSAYVSRGPTNLGGRTRSVAIDISDTSGNTMLAGGVSSGLFRSVDGGASWVKVSSNDEIHNVTAIAQDPRPGFQNIWYYGTGENSGNSASTFGAFYYGQGIWRSIDSGLTWEQIPQTNTPYETFEGEFDIIHSLAVSPINGDLFVAAYRTLLRYDGSNFTVELQNTNGNGYTDVKVTSTGRVFAAFPGNGLLNGVYTSDTGNGSYVNIAQNSSPAGWFSNGRIVLGIAPSNTNIVYALMSNGSGGIEADLWRYDLGSDTWTDFSSKLPDEPGGDLAGNDPFAIQGGYDLEVSVKPDDQNFVVIGGTNIYRINNIITDTTFDRIGGYVSNSSYGLYNLGGGDTHHPDIHDLVFSPFNSNLMYSGTDGGVHSADVTVPTVGWTNLNNNYQTYQYYHVAMDPQSGSDLVIGGAQDNGTTAGGAAGITGVSGSTDMISVFGGDGVAVSVGRTGTGVNFNDVQLYLGTQNGPLFSLVNGGFSDIRPSATTGNGNKSIFITYFYLDVETNTLYYVNGNDLYRNLDAPTADQFLTWEDIGSLSTNENIRSMASTRGTYSSASYTLIGGQNGGVFRLDDPRNTTLASAVNITPSGATVFSGSLVSGVAIHPTNPDIAMVVYSNYGIDNIFITSNATSASPTWDLVERNLATYSIRSAAIAEVNGQVGYFVGTARGLYASQDPTTTDWQLESPNEIGLAVVSSLVYRPSDNILLVGTHGNGMYQSDLTTLGVDESAITDKNVALYPNPSHGPVTIDYSGTQSLKSITVLDMSGKIISRQVVDGIDSSIQLDLNELSSGVYFVNITVDTGDSIIKRLIKQ
ncbi:T9SS type A sorting domain-containing protein [Psychroserpens algicola]|uniref:T9SS type A sorting domain-containing protein n=1 Tax=Psychroserpens algicola TaxID=1719034 RepID=A0ABT0H949_9FLAO|nr:T9SS type A sorting domain-containing protein [Psychroserpens algicola]MCK8480885.1 T9SS type A sorting domain-containing protein [Psychroserpens algicola]